MMLRMRLHSCCRAGTSVSWCAGAPPLWSYPASVVWMLAAGALALRLGWWTRCRRKQCCMHKSCIPTVLSRNHWRNNLESVDVPPMDTRLSKCRTRRRTHRTVRASNSRSRLGRIDSQRVFQGMSTTHREAKNTPRSGMVLFAKHASFPCTNALRFCAASSANCGWSTVKPNNN